MATYIPSNWAITVAYQTEFHPGGVGGSFSPKTSGFTPPPPQREKEEKRERRERERELEVVEEGECYFFLCCGASDR